jgi:hypothetical protein
LRSCAVCGDNSKLTGTKARYLHPRLDYLCSKKCILSRLSSFTYYSCKYPAGGVEVAEGIDQPDFAYSTKVHQAFRSNFEMHVADWFYDSDIPFEYEPVYFQFAKTMYTPDFWLPEQGVFIEVKGRWGDSKKGKLSQFMTAFPNVNLVLIPWVLRDEFYNGAN